MDGTETRKQQIARRLRVSEEVLEQYLRLKRAEVEEQARPAMTSPGLAGRLPRRPREDRV